MKQTQYLKLSEAILIIKNYNKSIRQTAETLGVVHS